ncbi:iron-sulfur cluster assembly protein NAR1 [Spizellomyces punctatus DAOM BR117]|uniref:Iron hydrogenase small subunit domain-containing protein n=1 Tax=Spizellomyces punctatus (strain DAOM BR117) TaxID=645134 RepID=A0A0L0HM16_SPIPD|nr:iron-sulfur cluster assembly protein NAR1 [Spizellomyces punctatus DAOM BR117]KND01864.1 hypothetical protein SPPG_03654 [Spizellomyces punctatus DAOM BR117]|eukprot:XP_016609903.1 hypothetical protein SPPG_03654 [Spizellomyces punctatus DAOM BR117]
MGFSGAVVLTDLNDFITPSQACIKPVEIKKTATEGTQIRVDDTGGYYEVRQDGGETKLETASISLNDCLACSGCITSAESVLITMQSQKELYEILTANKLAIAQGRPNDVRTIVVSVAPQSRASIAAKYNLTPLQVHMRLLWFFKQFLGVHYVFDTAFSRDFSLLESAKEFVRRYRQHRATGGVLPMLASACPGWICYAEKTHDYILPFIDTTKSPQQVMGSLVKDYLGSKIGLTPDKVYHVSVMPCYDKKLEASRQDFYNEIYSTRDVDCVITTGEVEKMFGEQGLGIGHVPEAEVESLFTKAVASHDTGIPMLAGTEGSSSGGYLSYIFRYAARVLYGINLTLEDVELGRNGVQVRAGRNIDFKEYTLTLPNDPTPVLKFAAAYGFRNIQNLVRKLKPTSSLRRRPTATSDYHFVEVMACPSGCINGGGQLKPDDDLASASRDWVARTEEAYRWVANKAGVQFPEANSAIGVLYQEWLGGEETEKARVMLHTGYRAVEKTNVSGLAVKW